MFVPTTNDLVLECSALEFGRDLSADEEQDEEEEAEGEIEECEEALERYELDHEEALEQLRNDTHDVRLDRLEDAYEECRRVRVTRRSSTAFVGRKSKDLVLDCSVLEFGRDSSEGEEEEEKEEKTEDL